MKARRSHQKASTAIATPIARLTQKGSFSRKKPAAVEITKATPASSVVWER